MSHAQIPAVAGRRAPLLRPRTSCVPALSAALVFAAGFAQAGPAPGKSYFFATRDACVASGMFARRECDKAFFNARAQLRDRAPGFATGGDCRLKFRLCEMRRVDREEGGGVVFSPLALGVEMMVTLRGVEAAPTLAVETPPGLLPRYPVARVYAAREKEAQRREEPGQTAILPADRFEPFSKRKPFEGAVTFNAYALGASDDDARSYAAQESPQERRERLRSAPFIE